MKITLGAIGSIVSIFMAVFFHFKHNTLGLICAFIAMIFFIILATLGVKDRNAEKKALPQRPMGVATDDNTRLIIKTISDETNGFGGRLWGQT